MNEPCPGLIEEHSNESEEDDAEESSTTPAHASVYAAAPATVTIFKGVADAGDVLPGLLACCVVFGATHLVNRRLPFESVRVKSNEWVSARAFAGRGA